MAARILVSVLLLAAPALSQTLTPEELLAQIDDRVAQADPYRAAMNDPDPERSRAAVEIMLESGEPRLVRMAAEFAVQSPDPALQRLGVEGIVSTKVPLTVTLDASEAEDLEGFIKVFNTYQDGAIEPNGRAHAIVRIGDFDAARGCYLQMGRNDCGVQVNGDGVFVTQPQLEGRFGYGEGGVMAGAAKITNYDTSLSATLRIVE